MFRPLQGRLRNIIGNQRYFCNKRRKYPIDPDHAESMPVFHYGISNERYQRLYVWGNIRTGALGVPYLKRRDSIEKKEAQWMPKRLQFAERLKVTTVACGFGFSAFAVNDGSNVKLYGSGLNTDSQIGYHAIREGKPLEIIFYPQPITLPFSNPTKTEVKKLSAGRAHLVAVTDEGLFLLGNNSYGQCGRRVVDDEDYFMSNYINHIDRIDGKTVIDIECGQDHTLALTEDGCVYSCGWGADGQTGLGRYDHCSEFTQVQGDIQSEHIVKMASRSDFVLALNDKGEVFGWGNAEYGQLQLPNGEQQVSTPTHLSMLQRLGPIADIATGGSFCLAVSCAGEVYAWGYGLLGAGPQVQRAVEPIKLAATLFSRNEFQPDCVVKRVSCGLSHAVALTNYGDIYTWGRNLRGCLGLGDECDHYFPFKVSVGGFVREVSCGVDHMIAVCEPFI